jgi:hypothetical protein
VEVSLLAVHARLVQLAELLLENDDIRIYSAEAWAKYPGAADYDQALHRDYLNHTTLVPATGLGYQQLEMFLYLVDVSEELGPPHFVSHTRTAEFPLRPNWYPRVGGADSEGGLVSSTESPGLYEAEVSAAGPAGTVVAFQPGTFHRGTALSAPRGARYSMHLGYRPAIVEWAQRQAWANCSHDPAWYQFVDRASPRQLQLFGFPPPGHPFWTADILSGMAQRYPGLDLSAWSVSPSSDKQKTLRQHNALDPICLKVFEEKISGKLSTGDRPALLDALSHIRDGDMLTVQEVDRLGRNLLEGLIVLNDLFQRGVAVKVLEGIAAGEHTERSRIMTRRNT